jgi:uncharacterized protein (DUF58 family)
MDTKELMRQVGQIRVITSRLVDEHLSGEYHSVFRGQGMEFDEVRAYTPGDDVRTIDWNVTARTGHPHIKRFAEERELTIIFLVDVSGSHSFGSIDRTKAETAAQLTALLALSAIKNQDNVGLILFSDRIEKSLPPRKGRLAALRIVREVLASEATSRGTDIAAALRFLGSVQKRKAVVFLISDFQDTNFEQQLRVTSRRHDLICCPIEDPRESELPALGLIDLQDAETGELVLVDTSSPKVRHSFAAAAASRHTELAAMLRRNKVDTIPLTTDAPFVDAVRKLFHQRQSRAARGL